MYRLCLGVSRGAVAERIRLPGKTKLVVRQHRRTGASTRELLERVKEMCKEARVSTSFCGWITSEDIDHHMDNTPILGNLAQDVNTSGGGPIHVAIPSNREAHLVAKGQRPASFPFTC